MVIIPGTKLVFSQFFNARRVPLRVFCALLHQMPQALLLSINLNFGLRQRDAHLAVENWLATGVLQP